LSEAKPIRTHPAMMGFRKGSTHLRSYQVSHFIVSEIAVQSQPARRAHRKTKWA